MLKAQVATQHHNQQDLARKMHKLFVTKEDKTVSQNLSVNRAKQTESFFEKIYHYAIAKGS